MSDTTIAAPRLDASSHTGGWRVLVCDHIEPGGLAALADVAEVDMRPPLAPADLAACIGPYDALMVRSATKVTAEVLAAARNLKIVGRAGVGVDNIDVGAATRHGVIVVNSPEGNTVAAAEHAIGLMLALARRIAAADAAMKGGDWGRERFVGTELYHKTLGVLGLGKIGQRVAAVGRALGMRVVGSDPFLSPEHARDLGVELVDFEGLLARSDFLTIHVPKTADTAHLFDAAALSRMKPGARLINAARGGIVDEAAVLAALESGQLAGAALDVFEAEPLPPDNVLRGQGGRVVLTPHLGASTEEAQLKVAVDVAEQIAAVLGGQPARSAVNIPTMRPEVLEPVRPFLALAETLGTFVGQLLDGPVHRLEILFAGGLAERKTDPLTTAVLKGLLSWAVEGVNYVNAPLVAKERGIEIFESRTSEHTEFSDLITVKATFSDRARVVAGTVFGDGDPRIVRIDEHAFNMEPSGYILIAPHQDTPGVVGRVGTLLGEANVNIYGLQLGRAFKRGPAVLALNVDETIPTELLARIAALPGFYDVRFVKLQTRSI